MNQLSLLAPHPIAPRPSGKTRRIMTQQELAVDSLERPDVQERIRSMVPLLRAAVGPSDVVALYNPSRMYFWVACTYLRPDEFDRVVEILVRVKGEYVLKAKMV